MELGFIIIRFDTPGQQKFVEEKCGLGLYEHETFFPDNNPRHYMSWSEYDISCCKAKDLAVFDELEDEWWDLSNDQKEAYEKEALKDVDE